MTSIPLHLQRRFEQRWAARSLANSGRVKAGRTESRGDQHALRPANAKEKPAGLRVKAQGK
jgi:hypothetical protein